MTNISKHYPKEKWKSYDTDDGRIRLTECWDAVCVRYALVDVGDFVGLEICWWFQFAEFYLLNQH